MSTCSTTHPTIVRAHHEVIAAASETELYGYDINTEWPSNGV